MKKILAILLVCGLMFSLCGCALFDKGPSDLASTLQDVANGDADADDLQSALDNYVSTISGNVVGFNDINEYVDTVTKSDDFKNSIEATKNQGMNMVLEADGNNLVYKYTYTVEVAENAEALLKQSFETNSSLFESSAKAIRIEAPCVEKVIWEYYTKDGKFIASVSK